MSKLHSTFKYSGNLKGYRVQRMLITELVLHNVVTVKANWVVIWTYVHITVLRRWIEVDCCTSTEEIKKLSYFWNGWKESVCILWSMSILIPTQYRKGKKKNGEFMANIRNVESGMIFLIFYQSLNLIRTCVYLNIFRAEFLTVLPWKIVNNA